MIGDKKLLAIIPARGGSKRLPRKNVLDLAGKPLIAWTIEAALNSSYIDRVIVSTDDEEIMSISRNYGADVPFMRPARFATDEAKSVDVVFHVIKELEIQGENYDFIILLQPTSPFRNSMHIDGAVKILYANDANSVISITKVKHNPLLMNTIPKSGAMNDFIDKKYQNIRSQDLPIYYQLNGAIYLCKVQDLLKEKTFFLKEKSFSYLMGSESSIDIDDKYDFLNAISINKLK